MNLILTLSHVQTSGFTHQVTHTTKSRCIRAHANRNIQIIMINDRHLVTPNVVNKDYDSGFRVRWRK